MKGSRLSNLGQLSFVVVMMSGFARPSMAQTAEDLINKNTAAKGGLAAIKAITSTRMVGKLETQGLVMQIGSDQKPDFLVRQSLTVQGMTQVQAYDGSDGWQINPFSGRRDPERMGEEDTRDLVETSDFYGPLIDYRQKGSKAEYIGHTTVDGDDALLLKVTLKNGDVIKYFLDPEIYLEIRTERMMFVRGKVRERFKNLGSYKKVNGVYFPFSIESGTPRSSDNAAKITLTSIEVNVPIPESEFKMPSAPAATSGAQAATVH